MNDDQIAGKWINTYQELHKVNGTNVKYNFWYKRKPMIINTPSKFDFLDELEQLMIKHHITRIEANHMEVHNND